MLRRLLLSAIFSAAGFGAQAAPFSIRCTDPGAFQPAFATYFATFELETERVVFEPRNVGGPSAHLMLGGPFPGTIREASADRISFSVLHSKVSTNFVWDRQRGELAWAGVVHPCVLIETRTLLPGDDQDDRPAGAPNPFSLRCTERGDGRSFYFTFDLWKKVALLEGWQSTSYYAGEVTKVEGNRAAFRLSGQAGNKEFVWDGSASTMSYQSVTDDGIKQVKQDENAPCTRVEVRTVMVFYCQHAWGPGPRPRLCL